MTGVRFKIFRDYSVYSTVEELANKWLEENPNVEIIDFKYSSTDAREESMCIMYKEREN